MANKKINELLSRTPSLSDLMLVGDPSSGYSYKCTVTALATIIETDIADGYVTLATTQTISGAKTFSNVLTLTSVANATTTQTKFLTLNGSNVVNYRTGAEVLADIGGASSSSISGTTNYVAKFTSSSAIGNSLIFDNGTNVGISTTSPSYKLDVNGTLRSTDSSYFATSSGNIGIGTNSVTGIGGPIVHIHAPTYPEIHLTNSTTGNQFQDGTSIHVNSSSLNILNYESGSINFSTSGTQRVSIASDGNITLSVIANATTDTDKFLVSDSGVIKYRTGAELLSDIGGQGSLSLSAIGSTPNANGATLSSNTLTLQPASASFGGVVTTGFQEFAGQKRFVGNPIQFDKHLEIKNNNSWGVSWGYTSFASKDTPVFGFLRGHSFSPTPTSYNAWFTYGTTGDRNYTLPSSDGTLALTSDITGAISGTTNYIPKFTSSSAIGNSVIYETSGNIGVGTITPQAYAGYRTLEIENTTGAVIRLKNAAATGLLEIATTSSETYYKTISNTPLTFGTNNSERMRLDASGNLGIGTSSPAYKLDVNGQLRAIAGDYHLLQVADGSAQLRLERTNSSTGSMYLGADNIGFKVFDGSFNTRLTLTSDGNLGLGVTPSAWRTSSKALQIVDANFRGESGLTGVGLNYYVNSSNQNIYINSDYATNYIQLLGEHRWYNAPSGTAGNAISFTQAMTLDASGRLGIGTTSPAYKITTSGGSSEGAIGIERTTVGTNTVIGALNFTNNNAGTVYGRVRGGRNAAGDGYVSLGTGVGDNLYAIEGGNVGIGTTSPASLLHTSGTSNIFKQFTTANNATWIEFQANSSGRGFYVGQDNSTGASWFGAGYAGLLVTSSADPIVFGTNSLERMRITSGGNVGIGTSSPLQTTTNRTVLTVNGTNSAIVNLGIGGSLGSYMYADASGGTYETVGTNSISANGANRIDFSTNGSERMRITSGGEVLINTTSDAGDYKLQVNGKVYANGALTVITSGGDILNFGRTDQSTIQLYQDGTNYGYYNTVTAVSDLIINNTTGAATFYSSIKTGAPSGYTAKPWKLGDVTVTSITVDTDKYISVDINGTVYNIPTCHPN